MFALWESLHVAILRVFLVLPSPQNACFDGSWAECQVGIMGPEGYVRLSHNNGIDYTMALMRPNYYAQN